MEPIFSDNAEVELDAMDNPLRKLFLKHLDKILQNPSARHMRFGLPFNVEETTRQARMVYQIEGTGSIFCTASKPTKNTKEVQIIQIITQRGCLEK